MTEAKSPAKKTPTKAPKAEKKAVSKPKAKKAEDGQFAVFATGGKQYMVSEGDTLKIEKMIGPSTDSGQAIYKEGDKLTFDSVLLVDDGKGGVSLGTPFIKGASIAATLTKVARHKKVTTIKYKQKSRYFKKYGHKQPYFEITIDSIK